MLIFRVVPECMLEPKQNGKKRRHPIHKKKGSQNEEEESVDAAKCRKVQKCRYIQRRRFEIKQWSRCLMSFAGPIKLPFISHHE